METEKCNINYGLNNNWSHPLLSDLSSAFTVLNVCALILPGGFALHGSARMIDSQAQPFCHVSGKEKSLVTHFEGGPLRTF